MEVSAIVLAAGMSRRFGENKLLLRYKGKPLISLVLDTVLTCGFDEVIVVYNNDDIYKEIYGLDIIAVYNGEAEKGQATSLRLGIGTAKAQNDYIIFLADQPLITKDIVDTLLSVRDNTSDKIIVPRYNGQNGMPTIFPNMLRNELLSVSGDVGGRYIIKNTDAKIFVDIPTGKETFASGKDVDRCMDYLELLGWCTKINGQMYSDIVAVYGGGMFATGVIHDLHAYGFKLVVLESEEALISSESDSFRSVVNCDKITIENVAARFTRSLSEIFECLEEKIIPVFIDTNKEFVNAAKPVIILDLERTDIEK